MVVFTTKIYQQNQKKTLKFQTHLKKRLKNVFVLL